MPLDDPKTIARLLEPDPEYCPGNDKDGNIHCVCWYDGQPCHYCGDDTPPVEGD